MLKLFLFLVSLQLSTIVTGSQSYAPLRPARIESPRYFDEFLLSVVSGGGFPDFDHEINSPYEPSRGVPERSTVSDRSRVNNRHMQRQSNDRRLDSNPQPPRSPLHDSLRQYVKQRHQQERAQTRSNDQEFTTTESAAENSTSDEQEVSSTPENAVFSMASQVMRRNVNEPRRSHSRRHISDNMNIDQMEQSLRGIPRQHWSCCTLGSLAGDKGFLCEAQFYASRILNRNANRVHNRRLSGTYFNNGEPTDVGMSIIQTFNSCVESEATASEFQGCCFRTLSEYNDRRARWRELRNAISVN